MSMLNEKSIQLIENLNDTRTISKETKFEVDLIENVYHQYLWCFRDIPDEDEDEGNSTKMRAIAQGQEPKL
jgi:hypothetical protein